VNDDPRASPSADGGRQPPAVPDHQLLRRVGAGAAGEVWLAKHTTLDEYRAIKFVRRDVVPDTGLFEREVEGLKRFEPVSREHRGLMDILQVSLAPDGQSFYYVMELADDANAPRVRGASGDGREGRSPRTEQQPERKVEVARYAPKTLLREVQRAQRLPPRKVLEVGIELAGALAKLHCAQPRPLVHRDVKPGNVVFVRGQPKLADPGLVAIGGEARSQCGTPGFMPLEGPGKPEADIFSLGKTLYFAATGKAVGQFPELPTEPVQPADRVLWRRLNDVICKACDDDPAQRYRDGQELLEDLERINAGKEPFGPQAAGKLNARLARALVNLRSMSPRQKLKWATASAVGVALLAWLISYLLHGLGLEYRIKTPLIPAWDAAMPVQWDGKAGQELVVCAGSTAYVFTATGSLGAPPIPCPDRKALSFGPCLVADMNGDGRDEVFSAWWTDGYCAVSVFSQSSVEGSRFEKQGRRFGWVSDARSNSEEKRFASAGGPPNKLNTRGTSGMTALRVVRVDPANAVSTLVLAVMHTGYGEGPRGLYCFDFDSQNLLWRHITAPLPHTLDLLDLDGDGRPEVLLGSNSVNNGRRETDGTDDGHCYLYAIKNGGECLWKKEVGHESTYVDPIVADLNGDGRPEILAWVWTRHDRREKGVPEIGRIVQFDYQGNQIGAAYDAGACLLSCLVTDALADGKRHVVCTDCQGFVHVLNADLTLNRKVPVVKPRHDYVEFRLVAEATLKKGARRSLVARCSQVRQLTSTNIGRPDQPPNVIFYEDNRVMVLSPSLRVAASREVLGKVSQGLTWNVFASDVDGDGGDEIVSLADDVKVLKLR